MRSTTTLSCLGALALVAGLCGGAKASDLANCANVKDDAERLACYDLLARESLSQEAREGSANASDEAAEREKIISRCREEMGEHGSAMVKYCAEEDIAAYRLCKATQQNFVHLSSAVPVKWAYTAGAWSSTAPTKTSTPSAP